MHDKKLSLNNKEKKTSRNNSPISGIVCSYFSFSSASSSQCVVVYFFVLLVVFFHTFFFLLFHLLLYLTFWLSEIFIWFSFTNCFLVTINIYKTKKKFIHMKRSKSFNNILDTYDREICILN